LKSAQSRKGENYDLDVAIQNYEIATQNVDKVKREGMGLTPDIRRLQRVSARNEAEIAKNKLITALDKPPTPAPVTEQAAPAEAPATEVAPTKEIEKKVNVNGINITAKVPIRYFRFGEPTIGEPSTNFLTGKKEKGISVYAGWTDPETGKIYLLPTETDETEFGEIIQTQDALLSSERKLVEVNGVDTGKIGADGETLLEPKSVSIVSEIDKNKLASLNDGISRKATARNP